MRAAGLTNQQIRVFHGVSLITHFVQLHGMPLQRQVCSSHRCKTSVEIVTRLYQSILFIPQPYCTQRSIKSFQCKVISATTTPPANSRARTTYQSSIFQLRVMASTLLPTPWWRSRGSSGKHPCLPMNLPEPRYSSYEKITQVVTNAECQRGKDHPCGKEKQEDTLTKTNALLDTRGRS